MISLVSLLAVGAITFVEQDIDAFGAFEYAAGHDSGLSPTFRHADLDGNGEPDLLLPTSVAFQRDGSFSRAGQTRLPAFIEVPKCDVWDSHLYFLFSDRMEVVRWAESGWQAILSQPVVWPVPLNEKSPGLPEDGANHSVEFDRFLFDLDQDGQPEIVRAALDAVYVFAKRGLFYEQAARWDIYPRARASVVNTRWLWPESKRVPSPPRETLHSYLRIEAGSVTVWDTSVEGQYSQGASRHRYEFATEAPFQLNLDHVNASTHSPVNALVRMGFLNNDDDIDYFYVGHGMETVGPLPATTIKTVASTDRGNTFTEIQSYGIRVPPAPFIDYNGDGRLDLYSENKHLLEGGIREALLRGLTRRKVDIEIEIRLQREDGSFPPTPDVSAPFTIELDRPPVSQSNMFDLFLNGRLVRLLGDLTSDGILDVVIMDRPNRIAVHPGGTSSIARNSIATLSVPEGSQFTVSDMNSDGRADLIVFSSGPRDAKPAAMNRIYLTRETLQ